MKIYIASDHNGYEMKDRLTEFLHHAGYEVVDAGDHKLNPEDDYPQFAARAVAALKASNDPEPRAILICGSGQGMCIAANRFKGIRACLCWDEREARVSRNDDDSNVLCLPARYVGFNHAEAITKTWLETAFAGAPRFARRIREIEDLGP